MESSTIARDRAIFALAINRTDQSVQVLKSLLADPDEKVRRTVQSAIQGAYVFRGKSTGRPLKPEDFDEKFRNPNWNPITDPELVPPPSSSR
jgi:hypothetical protein